jgi:hypothetical protein
VAFFLSFLKGIAEAKTDFRTADLNRVALLLTQ